jgi:integrase
MSYETLKAPRRVRGEGSIYRKVQTRNGHKYLDRTWTIQYYKDGADGKRERMREATGTASAKEAQRILRSRLDQIDRGEAIETRRAVRIEELFAGMKDECLKNHRDEAAQRLTWQWEKHLQPVFGNLIANRLTTDDVTGYIRRRQEEGAADATINRELSALRRMFNLGRQCTPPKVRVAPIISLLPENNTRLGFVEPAQYRALVELEVPLWLRALFEIYHTYGWRKSEPRGMRVRQVDFEAGVLRLDPGTTKNGEGREVPMTATVRNLLVKCALGKKPDERLFTREQGEPVKDFRVAWRNWCIKAGVGRWVCKKCKSPWKKPCACGSVQREFSPTIHDLRRTGARNLRRKGVPESVIQKIGGWKTRAMFERYNIVDGRDTREAINLLEDVSPSLAPFSAEAAPVHSETGSAKVQ